MTGNRLAGLKMVLSGLLMITLAACGRSGGGGALPSAQFVPPSEGPGPNYIIGPLDNLSIFVWRNPDLTTSVTVRPDGRISVPLIEDLPATGQTPTALARAIEGKLSTYIQNPIVTVMVGGFRGPLSQQVRVVGEAAKPQAISFQANMTLLDVMVAVGGLTDFAAGNSATLVRFENGQQHEYKVRISSLLKDGDIKANVAIMPGDVLIIPQSLF